MGDERERAGGEPSATRASRGGYREVLGNNEAVKVKK
jgi:hypothetical protein